MSQEPGFWARGMQRLGYSKNVDKLLEEAHSKAGLKKSLGAFDLVTLGVAGIIGAGIFVLIGQGIEKAGILVVPAFLVAALICAVAGYAYAELASAIPASGSAYAYLYTALGELPGWTVAWALVLEYAVGAIAVAVGWRNNFLALIKQLGASWPDTQAGYALTHSPFESVTRELVSGNHITSEHFTGMVNLPAIAIVLVCTGLLVLGTKESARFTLLLVAIKVAILLMAIGVGFMMFNADNLTTNPVPSDVDGIGAGLLAVFAAAAIMFFAYIGFDSVSTTAEETRNPRKDLPIGILGSLGITTLLYILAAVALVGAAPTTLFAGDSETAQLARGEPFGYVFEQNGVAWAAILVRIGALIGTTSVLLVLILGGVRVFFNMSRDGLLPAWMSRVSRRGAPAATTLLYGGMTMLFAGFLTLGTAVELVNIGTLFAFVMVVLAAWVFRVKRPDIDRPFRMPMWSVMNARGKPLLPIFVILGMLGILAMLFSLPAFTLVAAVTWMGLGLVVYGLYGVRHSREAENRHVLGPSLVASAGAPARPAAPELQGGDPLAFRHNGFTLYARDVSGRPLYFFSKATPKSGQPVPLPAGYEVGSNPKTGLPYLKRSA